MERMREKAQAYFEAGWGTSLDHLLIPIAGSSPGGEDLRGTSLLRQIREARRYDDPSVPLGEWEYELKQADWRNAARLIQDTLCTRSKDLQLAAWLAEAAINEHSFAALGPCLYLLAELCRSSWLDLHPAIQDGDLSHRINIFLWLDEKLIPSLKQLPVTECGRPKRELHWADWEHAHLHKTQRSGEKQPSETVGIEDFMAAMASTPTDAYQLLLDSLQDAVEALEYLTAILGGICGDEAPSMRILARLLDQIGTLVEGELRKRGAIQATASVPAAEEEGGDAMPASGAAVADAYAGPIHDRADAYACLAAAAEYLIQTEPHSPVPYLVRQAVSWGHLNTVELYQELFVKRQGQLHIYDMLGLQQAAPTSDTH